MPAHRRSDQPEIVRPCTEWDPLEEVVVGWLAGVVFPTWQSSMRATMPEESWQLVERYGGSPLPEAELEAAEQEPDDFAAASAAPMR